MHHVKIAVLFSLLSLFSAAQTTAISPYSSQGLGDVSFYGDAYFMGMGGITSVLADSAQTNLYNPSTYSLISKSLPLFSMGVNYQFSNFTQNDLVSSSQFTNLTHMALAIPFGNRYGLAFGIKPYSRMGYEINSFELVDNDTMFYDYIGSGDVFEFNLGFAVSLIQQQKHTLSLGFNGKHYFGRLNNRRMAFLKVNLQQIGAFDDDILSVSSQGIDFGGTYQFRPSNSSQLSIATTFQPGMNLNVDHGSTRVQYGNITSPGSYDTLIPFVQESGSIAMPQRFHIGLSYEIKPSQKADGETKRKKLPSYLFALEYGITNWSSYQEDIPSRPNSPAFADMTSLRAGFQYTPHRSTFERAASIKFYDRFSYRIGFYNVNLPYLNNGENLVDNGMSFGLIVPVVINRAVSTLNFAVNYGNRTMDTPNGVNERYIGAGFSLNISPSYDRWFRRYQLD
jgi:hypothetical protein